MRNENIVKFLITCSVLLVFIFIFNIFVLRTVRRQYAPGMVSTVSIFNISGQFHEWFWYVSKWRDLVEENKRLQALVDTRTTNESVIQSLESENEILRKSLGLSARFKRHVLPAGIFNISLTPDGYHALINKGQKDAVTIGQAVISPEGILVGKINTVFSNSAQVMFINDPSFSVTVQVLHGQTTGILQGALNDGLIMKLVTQSDKIVEGDTLITTGNDMIPAGLVVGLVRNVENNDTQLFKRVNVNPVMNPSQGTVVVIQ